MEASPDLLPISEDRLLIVHEPLAGGFGERLGVVQECEGVQRGSKEKDPAAHGGQPGQRAVGAVRVVPGMVGHQRGCRRTERGEAGVGVTAVPTAVRSAMMAAQAQDLRWSQSVATP